MYELLFGLLSAVIVAVVLPPLVPQQARSWFSDSLARVIGALIFFFAIASTSYVHVPDGHLGQLFRVYGGGSLTEGRIVAVHGENGPQAKILTPGFHAWLLVNVLYNVDTSKTEVSIPKGKVGILTAKDGASAAAGSGVRRPVSGHARHRMLDAETFLTNGGQRGPQLSVLTPGKYRLNRYLWDIAEVDAKEVKAGFVGVVKSNVHAEVDFGTLKADKPANCDLISTSSPSLTKKAGSMRRSCRSAASASGTSRSSRASTTSTPRRSRSPKSIRARRCGPTPAAIAGRTSRSRSMPRAISSRTAPRSTSPSTRKTPTGRSS